MFIDDNNMEPILLITAPTEHDEAVFNCYWTTFDGNCCASAYRLSDGRVMKFHAKDHLEGAAAIILSFLDSKESRSTYSLVDIPDNFESGWKD